MSTHKNLAITVLLLLIPIYNVLIATGHQRSFSKDHETLYDYPSFSMEKSRPNHRVAGGYPAREGEFPSFVGLVGFAKQIDMMCNGVAISDRLILTAAHCFNPIQNFNEIKAAASIYHPKLWKAKRVKTYDVDLSCRSPLYRINSDGVPVHDYHILSLKTPIRGMNFSRLAGSEIDFGAHAVAVGTGMTSNENDRPKYPDSLQALPVQRVRCEYGEPSHICFQSYEPEHVGDTCGGDSGGPIYARGTSGNHVVVGLTSFGRLKCREGYNGASYNVNVYECLNEIMELAKLCS